MIETTNTIQCKSLWDEKRQNRYLFQKIWDDKKEKLLVILRAMRREIGLESVPFLMGGLGDYLKDCPQDESLHN